MCVVLPLSVNECNLRKVYTIAPREVRKISVKKLNQFLTMCKGHRNIG
jgi:hypothetical protein